MKRKVKYILLLLALFYLFATCRTDKGIIKVGVLHSLSGTMAISERAVANATLMAIDEINQAGGILGKKIEAILVDGKSDWGHFAREAERLITQEKVSVIFGCWTSASRKTVKPIFESYNHLLFYPVQYEGLETSPNIVYTGAAPNQQVIPATKWAFDNIGKRFFIVGSDYVYPRVASQIIQDIIKSLGGEVVGDEYILLGSKDVKPVIDKILKTKPDVIMNNINGDSNVEFFKQLRAAGITNKQIPTFSFSIAEDELRSLDRTLMAGDYTAWNYFQSIDTERNKTFVENYKKKYGKDAVTDDPIEAGYISVYLWKAAVEKAGTEATNEVRKNLADRSFIAPEGLVYIDGETQHTWKTVRIGKFRLDGQVDIIWSSDKPIRPIPYPTSRSQSEWNLFLAQLFDGWGGNWANLSKK
ncbi:MAG: urea ABC transporter substrate-binding protein [Microscillaceae bacterium]|nr:urea ABC transporter substrate-binding protein [Microscillaceae bacterium]MDW8459976.1 urea ABC transporter substrate-binding protein [Cytophagales bacterium]